MKVDYHWNLIDQIAASILVLDALGEVQYLNDPARELLGLGSEVDVTELDFSQFVCQTHKPLFDRSLGEVIEGEAVTDLRVDLTLENGEKVSVTLAGKTLDDQVKNGQLSIWTLVPANRILLNHQLERRGTNPQDLNWLAAQGRRLISLENQAEILFQSCQDLQEKLGDCFILTFSLVDDSNIQLDGIYGIDNYILNQAWKMIGKNLHNFVFPIDENLKESFSQKSLIKLPGGLEDLAVSQVPKNVSRKLSKLVGLKDIYSIRLEGKQATLGYFFILTINDRPPIPAELVEPFAFQVVLALEKSIRATEFEIREDQFQTIFEYAPDGYFISDLQGTILNANSAAERISGFTRDEMIGKSFLKQGLLAVDQIPRAEKIFTQSVRGDPVDPVELDLIRKDGSAISVEILSYPVMMGDQPVILGIARDMSERKITEQSLTTAHNTLTRVLEGIDAHVYVADMNTYEILYMNKRMIEDYGGNHEGKRCYEIFNGFEEPCPNCSNPQLIDPLGFASEVVVWEGQNIRNQRWYRNMDRAINWIDQRLVRLQIAVDITDSKLASTALQESENRYRSLFESSINPLMTLSSPDWNFTSGNSAMIGVFGLRDEKQFLSLQPWQLSPEYQPDGRLSDEKAREMIQIAIDQGSHFFNWTHKKISGETFPATVLLNRVNTGEDIILQATVRDISEQVQAKQKLTQQRDDLAVINKLTSAANAGHSLNELYALFSEEMKGVFNSNNTRVYLLDRDEKVLEAVYFSRNGKFRETIRKLLKNDIPARVKISLKNNCGYGKLIVDGQAKLLTSQADHQEVLKEMLLSLVPEDELPKKIKILLPQLYKNSEVVSLAAIPTLNSGQVTGLVDVSFPFVLSAEDLKRIAVIVNQLSAIIHKIKAEQDQARKLQELRFLNKAIGESSRIDDVDELCELLAGSVHEINPNAYILVSLFDPATNAIRLRALKGIGDISESLFKILGGIPEDFLVNTEENLLDDDLTELYTSGNLERIPGGLYDLTRGTLPKTICKSLEKMAGFDDVYFVGFGLGGQSVGGLILLLNEGEQINFPEAIQVVVSNFAVVFERRKIQMEVLHRKQQLEALREIELEIARDLDIESLLHSISEKSKAIVNASATGFGIYNPDRGVLEYTAYTGFEKLPENTDIRPGEGLSGKVWESKKTITVEKYAEWESKLETWVPVGDYYLAGIPINSGDEMLGVLEIAMDPGKSLSASELSMLELFATQAAIALKNARLFSNEKLRRIEADTLREVGVMINKLVDHPELLDMILTSLQKIVSYNSASIQLVKGSDVVVEAYFGTRPSEDVIGRNYQIHGNKLLKKVLKKGENIILGNEIEVSDWLEDVEQEQIRSFLAVPLESKTGRIGILTLNHFEPDHFTSRDGNLVRDFSAQAVVAIENNRLFEDIRRKTEEIEAVYASALSLTKELHPDVLFDQLYQQIEPLFKPDAYVLATYEENLGMIKVAYATESGTRQPQAEGLLISPEEHSSLLGWIVRKKIPLLIGNVEKDSLPLIPHQRAGGVRSWLGVPLLIGDRVTGALVVQSYEADMYTGDHQRLIQLLGNQVAIALENSRLFDEAQRRLSRLSSLREIDEAISGGTNLELTMDVLIRQLVKTLEVDAACVLEYKPANHMLDYVGALGFRTKSLQYTSLKLGEGLAGKAALEQNLVILQDLNDEKTSFQQSPSFEQEEFVTYLAQPLITTEGLVGVLEVFHRSPLAPTPEWFLSLDAIARLAAIAIDRLNLYTNLKKTNIDLVSAYDATIEGWAKAIELRDGDTEGHSRRVAALTTNLARMMNISGEELVHMRRGALLHDIGKMAIPDGILLKAGKLSDEEWIVMKKHPAYAHDMLSKIDYLKPALDIPVSHHERWDGSGYPEGLSGEDIPIQARIFAVVDVWDALQSDRPYREAWTEAKTIEYLKEQSGKEFDPRIVREFLELLGKS